MRERDSAGRRRIPRTGYMRPVELSTTGVLGNKIYEQDIRSEVIDDHVGEIVAIDIETGAWALGPTVHAATARLREACPSAKQIWSVRVGYHAVARLGGGSPPSDER